jgi:hypothetical protein
MTPHPVPTRTVLENPVPLALPTRDFAFYGRVSTEDQQDPEASRNWQKTRANGLIEPLGGRIITDFFDIGMSRSIPWQRRPDATALLDALADRNRGFDAVVIGEPQRAFYDNQYSLTMPLFSHYGVQLWVPEVGGAIDPSSERAGCDLFAGFISPDRAGMDGKRLHGGFGRGGLGLWRSAGVTRVTWMRSGGPWSGR